jgi:RNA polymerase sigma-70 factor (ECF subfamily)
VEDTRATLLSKIRQPGAHRAWEEFYHLYGPIILAYSKKRGLDEKSAEDVLQETMIALMRIMPDFRYDEKRGKFRNYLIGIVRRKIANSLRRKAAIERKEVAMEVLFGPSPVVEGVIDPDMLSPDQAVDLLWVESLHEEAWRRVVKEFPQGDRSVAVYEAYERNGRTASEVARKFGIKVNAVYQIKSRIGDCLERKLAPFKNGLEELAER